MPAPSPDRVVVITGASSGIGAALARGFAQRPGTVLGLIGRNAERLDAVAAECRVRGAVVETAALDIRDRAGLAAWLAAFDSRQPIDCLVANAGVSSGTLTEGGTEDGQAIYDVFDVNITGTLNLVVPMLPRFKARRGGRIVLVSSLAAFAPLPDAGAYSGSKAALFSWGMALRESLAPHGIAVNVVCPGFVTTPMAATFRGLKPLEMTVDRAADRILRGLGRNRRTIAFPLPMVAAARLATFVPEPLFRLGVRLFKL